MEKTNIIDAMIVSLIFLTLSSIHFFIIIPSIKKENLNRSTKSISSIWLRNFNSNEYFNEVDPHQFYTLLTINHTSQSVLPFSYDKSTNSLGYFLINGDRDKIDISVNVQNETIYHYSKHHSKFVAYDSINEEVSIAFDQHIDILSKHGKDPISITKLTHLSKGFSLYKFYNGIHSFIDTENLLSVFTYHGFFYQTPLSDFISPKECVKYKVIECKGFISENKQYLILAMVYFCVDLSEIDVKFGNLIIEQNTSSSVNGQCKLKFSPLFSQKIQDYDNVGEIKTFFSKSLNSKMNAEILVKQNYIFTQFSFEKINLQLYQKFSFENANLSFSLHFSQVNNSNEKYFVIGNSLISVQMDTHLNQLNFTSTSIEVDDIFKIKAFSNPLENIHMNNLPTAKMIKQTSDNHIIIHDSNYSSFLIIDQEDILFSFNIQQKRFLQRLNLKWSFELLCLVSISILMLYYF